MTTWSGDRRSAAALLQAGDRRQLQLPSADRAAGGERLLCLVDQHLQVPRSPATATWPATHPLAASSGDRHSAAALLQAGDRRRR